MTEALEISGLFVYPIKGCAAIALDALELGPRGARWDREWMVVDGASGRFVTQRSHPRLALARTALTPDALRVEAPEGAPPLELPLAHRAGRRVEVTVWRDTVEAVDEGDEAAAFFAALLDDPAVRLVRVTPDFARVANPARTPPGTPMGFADGYPLLVACEASLADLGAHLTAAVPMSRFRPNLVVRGGAPWQEEGWRSLRVAGLELGVVSGCTRCKVTTIDQATAQIPEPGEPLATLGRLRPREDATIVFGQNLLSASGTVRVGDRATAG